MRALLGTIAVLALVGSTGAHAQGVYVEPAPVYVNPAPYPYYAAPPVVVAPAPSAIYVAPSYGYGYGSGYGYGEAYIDDYRTGRWCRIEQNGYRWCWTP